MIEKKSYIMYEKLLKVIEEEERDEKKMQKKRHLIRHGVCPGKEVIRERTKRVVSIMKRRAFIGKMIII